MFAGALGFLRRCCDFRKRSRNQLGDFTNYPSLRLTELGGGLRLHSQLQSAFKCERFVRVCVDEGLRSTTAEFGFRHFCRRRRLR